MRKVDHLPVGLLSLVGKSTAPVSRSVGFEFRSRLIFFFFHQAFNTIINLRGSGLVFFLGGGGGRGGRGGSALEKNASDCRLYHTNQSVGDFIYLANSCNSIW